MYYGARNTSAFLEWNVAMFLGEILSVFSAPQNYVHGTKQT
jgi:hypothetical protein